MRNKNEKRIDDFFDEAEAFADSIGRNNVAWNDYPDGDSITHAVEDKASEKDVSIMIDNDDKDEEEYYQNKKKVFGRKATLDGILKDLP